MEEVNEPTAEELMLKFLAPVKLEFRVKKTATTVVEDSVPIQPLSESKTEDDTHEAEDLNGKDSAKDSKRRKDIRGQNRDSKRHKSYDSVQSMRCYF